MALSFSSTLKLLIPYDFSEFSEQALAQAVELCRGKNAHLTILHVFQNTWVHENMKQWSSHEQIKAQLEEKLEQTVKTVLAEASNLSSQILLVDGEPQDEILNKAQKLQCDLIVMGSHGRRGLKRLFLGSVVEKVTRRSNIPVLVSRSQVQPFKHILVPVDFSDFSQEALQLAQEMVLQYGAQLTAFHVIDLVDLYAFEVLSHSIDRTTLEQNLRDQATQKLKAVASKLSCNHQIDLKLGDPITEIEDAISQKTVDLVILPTHGRTGLQHVLMGSIAERVVRLSPCSVLVFRPQAMQKK